MRHSKRKPVITKPSFEYIQWEITGKSEDIDATEENINHMARNLAARAEQMDITPSSFGSEYDLDFIDHLLELDFIELKPDELRQLSHQAMAEQDTSYKHEDNNEDQEGVGWVVINVK
jgi:hypothetical protein